MDFFSTKVFFNDFFLKNIIKAKIKFKIQETTTNHIVKKLILFIANIDKKYQVQAKK